MHNLIARIEAGTRPDRHLDMEIHDVLCDGFDMMPDATEADVAGLLVDEVDAAAVMEACGGFAVMTVPEYTLDRAAAVAKLRSFREPPHAG